MASSPLVSVIIPVYNAERYLRYCIDSVLAQSHRNIEVILVDDGSQDASPLICDEYAARDPRVTVIHQGNGGISHAQNAGLDATHGEYIAFADNDDILDRRNIELLLHALESTGADMSKARWRQFGVSRLDEVAAEAAVGAAAPRSVTVFRDPLRAYQTVFCKSLRLIGERLGRHTEARYCNEANWCRLYRRELWDGIRFPEGMYAQDVMVAGELYSRMDRVADIDVVLYHWLQSSGSVTHALRDTAFYADNVAAGMANFRLASGRGVLPARSHYTMTQQLAEGRHASDADAPGSREVIRRLASEVGGLVAGMSPMRRLQCRCLAVLRRMEKTVYDRKVKRLR